MSAVNRFDSSKKIALIKEVRAATSLGLKEVGCHAMPTVAVLNAAIGALHMLICNAECCPLAQRINLDDELLRSPRN